MDIDDRRRKRNDESNENNCVNNNKIQLKKTKTGEAGNDVNSTNTTTNSDGDSNLVQSINGELIVPYCFVISSINQFHLILLFVLFLKS